VPQERTSSSQGPLSKKLRINERGQRQTVLQQLVAYDDIITDILVDYVSYPLQVNPIVNELKLTFI
jgi:hypothetical protein